MKLDDKIKLLETERDEHLRQANIHFTRLKHRLTGKHLLKAHLPAAIALAFASGIAIIPSRKPKSSTRPSMFKRLLSFAGGRMRAHFEPPQEPQEAKIPQPPHVEPEIPTPPPPQSSLLFTQSFELTPNSALAVSLHWLKRKPPE